MSADGTELEFEDYWSAARRPLCGLVFLLPVLAVYELGVLFLDLDGGIAQIRNGADSWMRGWLLAAGFEHVWLLPTLMIAVLGGWHLLGRHPSRCSASTLIGMLAESLLFAFALVVLGQLLSLGFQELGTPVASLGKYSFDNSLIPRAISFLGAGLYEEFLFRLALLPVCVLLLRRLMPMRAAIVTSVLLTSVIFAAAHYVTPTPDAWGRELADATQRLATDQSLWFGFTFRTLAGAVFGTLFFSRGFGVTVGSHAIYDLMVGVVMYVPDQVG